MCPWERFSYYKSLSRLFLCYKKDWATLLHFIYFCYLLLVTIYLITKLFVTTYFSTCRVYLAENCLSFPSAPRWVRHSYLSKGLWYIPYTCGSSTPSMPMTCFFFARVYKFLMLACPSLRCQSQHSEAFARRHTPNCGPAGKCTKIIFSISFKD